MTVKKIYVLELNSDGYKDLLIKRISNDKIVNIEYFLGYSISGDIVESGLENKIRMVLDQMSDEEYNKWESKYLFDMPEV